MNELDRSTFIKRCLQTGVGLSLYTSLSGEVFAASEGSKEEMKKEKAAKYVFNFGSPYKTSESKTTPHAHQAIKSIVEKRTNNKVYVKIHDAGSAGIGSSLSNAVKFGTVQGALLSVSNLSPMAKELDVLNIPFWSSNTVPYVNVFTSDVFHKHVLAQISKFKIQVLFPYIVGARTATSTKKYGKTIKALADFEGIKFRIPGSKSLKNFYKISKAKPVTIAWKLTAKNARGGRFDALDSSIAGLYAGPDGLRKSLGVISTIASVHDGWVAIGNSDFVNKMDPTTKKEFLQAMDEVQKEQVALQKKAEDFSVAEFAKLGTKVYRPTPAEVKALSSTLGHTHNSWIPIKKRLFGKNGVAIFDSLYKAANG